MVKEAIEEQNVMLVHQGETDKVKSIIGNLLLNNTSFHALLLRGIKITWNKGSIDTLEIKEAALIGKTDSRAQL